MKNQIKILAKLILIATLIISCSNDNNQTDETSRALKPPSWIIGTWNQTNIEVQGYSTKFVFDTSNVKWFIDGIESKDFSMYENNTIPYPNSTKKLYHNICFFGSIFWTFSSQVIPVEKTTDFLFPEHPIYA